MESLGNPLAVAQLVSASAAPFASLLRNVAHLLGAPAATRTETAVAGALAVGLPEAVVRQVLSLSGSTTGTADGARLFPAYLAAVEQLAHAVDTWRP